ncbi:MAG: hypothetical protein DRI44_04455 [Chlamydiae bacterium]|nr:MAG: hypothetical protein DRI44_04455 [Chlamydiota bacterium]
MRNLKNISETASEINIEKIESPPVFLYGAHIFLSRFLYFIIAGLLPVIVLILTSVSEFSIKNSGVVSWMYDSKAYSFFQFLIYVIRFISFGAMLAAWSWLAGDIMFRDAESAVPSLSDAINTAWKSAIRTSFSTFFTWMLITIYAQFTLILCKAVWIIFLPTGYIAASIALILSASWAVLPIAALMGKFIFAIPLVVFEEMPSMAAISFSSKLVPFKYAIWKWPVILFCGFLLFITIVIPSWTYIDSFVNLITTSNPLPIYNLKIQIAGAVWMLIMGPLAISVLTAFYFINSPRYWHENIPLTEAQIQTEN